MTYLLDVNVLMALIDPVHLAHEATHTWFEQVARYDWATCTLTKNGVIRIIGNPKYANTPGSPGAVTETVTARRKRP